MEPLFVTISWVIAPCGAGNSRGSFLWSKNEGGQFACKSLCTRSATAPLQPTLYRHFKYTSMLWSKSWALVSGSEYMGVGNTLHVAHQKWSGIPDHTWNPIKLIVEVDIEFLASETLVLILLCCLFFTRLLPSRSTEESKDLPVVSFCAGSPSPLFPYET